MRKSVCLILILSFTAACGGGGGGGGGRRQNPVAGPNPTPGPSPFGAALQLSSGTTSSSATGIMMKASISGGGTRVLTSASGVAAEVSVGVPATSR